MKAILPLMILAGWIAGAMMVYPAHAAESEAINDLNIEDLLKVPVPAEPVKNQLKSRMLNMKVSSVGKSQQSLSSAAAAVYVIDNEAIKRSGATSVPEVLRLAPGIDVARINNSKWAVTARGFNGRYANKLLVLIDGRSVYTPLFSGVYWDSHDVMLEDVERIEIIRGPGATLWGANAMNGVINIITKHTEDTQGGLLTGGGGSTETAFGSLRYGRKITEGTYGRAYVKGFRRDDFTPIQTANNNADSRYFQGGFRVDSNLSPKDTLAIYGNGFQGEPKQTLYSVLSPTAIFDNSTTEGWNFTSRYNHVISGTADYSLQFYYDHVRRDDYMVSTRQDILDLDFQNSFAIGSRQNIIWGLGYRCMMDSAEGFATARINPKTRNTQLFSSFIQDEVSFFDDALLLTFGSKLEHNDYTGIEVQPSANVVWTPAAGHKLWASISRAIRTPSRLEQNSDILIKTIAPGQQGSPLTMPINVYMVGNPAFKSERQVSYQLGYRHNFNKNLSLDLATFYNDYQSLRGSTFGLPTFGSGNFLRVPLVFDNSSSGSTYGIELSTMWQMLDWWRWDLNYSWLNTDIQDKPSAFSAMSAQAMATYISAISPKHTVSLRVLLNPTDKVSVDLWGRYVSTATNITNPNGGLLTVNGYLTLDARLAWRPYKNLELSIVGQNLLQNGHLEYYDEAYGAPAQIPRSIYGKFSLQF